MERKKEKKIKWRKNGGGTFRLKPQVGSPKSRGRKIKAYETFDAYPSEIPKAFRDNIVPLETLPDAPEEAPVDVAEPDYKLKRRSGGFYHVLDSNDKVLTEDALRKDEALAFIERLKS